MRAGKTRTLPLRLLCQVSAVETERNEQRRGIAWQFTSRDARRKVEQLYPVKETSSDSHLLDVIS